MPTTLVKPRPSSTGQCVHHSHTALVCVQWSVRGAYLGTAGRRGITARGLGGWEPQDPVGPGSRFQTGSAHRDSQGLPSRFCCRFGSPAGGTTRRRPPWAFTTQGGTPSKGSHGMPCVSLVQGPCQCFWNIKGKKGVEGLKAICDHCPRTLVLFYSIPTPLVTWSLTGSSSSASPYQAVEASQVSFRVHLIWLSQDTV